MIITFLISLIESLFILPAHLTFKQIGNNQPQGLLQHIAARQKGFNRRFEHMVQHRYAPFMERVVIRSRYTSVALFLAVLLAVGGYVFSGRAGMMLFPRVESDYAFASATLRVGSPYEKAKEVADRLIDAARKVIDENGGETLSEGMFSSIEENMVEIRIYLTDPDTRPISTAQFTSLWREKLGENCRARGAFPAVQPRWPGFGGGADGGAQSS